MFSDLGYFYMLDISIMYFLCSKISVRLDTLSQTLLILTNSWYKKKRTIHDTKARLILTGSPIVIVFVFNFQKRKTYGQPVR
jgi:hypothetical protein